MTGAPTTRSPLSNGEEIAVTVAAIVVLLLITIAAVCYCSRFGQRLPVPNTGFFGSANGQNTAATPLLRPSVYILDPQNAPGTATSAVCRICRVEPACIAFLPCKHAVCCTSCARMVTRTSSTRCPECSVPIETVVDVNLFRSQIALVDSHTPSSTSLEGHMVLHDSSNSGPPSAPPPPPPLHRPVPPTQVRLLDDSATIDHAFDDGNVTPIMPLSPTGYRPPVVFDRHFGARSPAPAPAPDDGADALHASFSAESDTCVIDVGQTARTRKFAASTASMASDAIEGSRTTPAPARNGSAGSNIGTMNYPSSNR